MAAGFVHFISPLFQYSFNSKDQKIVNDAKEAKQESS